MARHATLWLGLTLVLLAGVPCDFRLDYGAHISRRAAVVSANRSPGEISKNRRPTLAVPGAPELFLRALARRAPGPRAPWGAWRETLQARDAARDAQIAGEAAAASPGGINPLRVLANGQGAAAVDIRVRVG